LSSRLERTPAPAAIQNAIKDALPWGLPPIRAEDQTFAVRLMEHLVIPTFVIDQY
jgi:hypothetical protein